MANLYDPKSKSDVELRASVIGHIRTIENFPHAPIMFRDITTLLKHPQGLRDTIELFLRAVSNMEFDVVVGVEARGFMLAPSIALARNVGFVPARKKGKLPAAVYQQEYALEYGTDVIEMHVDAIEPGQRALIVDDLIATGGTLEAACKLVEKAGGNVVACVCIVELPALKGRSRLGDKKIVSLVEFDGE
jgi:adenine phosphoribosyltransferase